MIERDHIWSSQDAAEIERAVRHELGVDVPGPLELALRETIENAKTIELQEYFEVLDTCRG